MRLALRIFAVLAIGVIAAAAAVWVTLLQPVQYKSTSVLLIAGPGNRTPTEPAVRSLEALIVSPPVAAEIATRAKVDLSSEQVLDRMTAIRPPASAVLEVSFLDTDRDRGAALAREAGPSLVAQLAKPASNGGQVDQQYGLVTVNGEPTTDRVEPPRLRNGAIGLGLGLLVGLAFVSLRPRRSRREGRDTSAAEVGEAFEAPLYATLPILGSGSWRAHSLDVPEEQLPTNWPPAERRLVVLATGGRASVRLVQLLATAVTQSGRDVLVVDAEPEERGLTAAFGLHGRPGFVDCLTGRADPVSASVLLQGDALPREMSALVPPGGGRIFVLPAGEVDVPPAALAARATHVLGRMKPDVTVIVHAPRVPGTYPANQFVEFADAVIVPAVAGRTPAEEVQAASRLVLSLTPAPMYPVLLTDRAQGGAGRTGDGERSLDGYGGLRDDGVADEPVASATTT